MYNIHCHNRLIVRLLIFHNVNEVGGLLTAFVRVSNPVMAAEEGEKEREGVWENGRGRGEGGRAYSQSCVWLSLPAPSATQSSWEGRH